MKRIHWCDWQNMCKLKKDGGMGFRDMRIFNIALLAKQGWSLINYPNSLVASVLKDKYYPNSNFMHSNLGFYRLYMEKYVGYEGCIARGCMLTS